MSRVEDRDLLVKIMEGLNERERFILFSGILGRATFEDTGRVLGISRERARQIHVKAIRKINRHYHHLMEKCEGRTA